jgi:hypothetical protein
MIKTHASVFRAFVVRGARNVATTIWGCSLLSFVGISLAECVYWLKHARWPHWTIKTAIVALNLQEPSFSWLGIRAIWADIAGSPLWLIALLAGFFLALLSSLVGRAFWRLM